MWDIKWVKFEVTMYEDIKLKILDDMENRDLYHYVWARSVVLAGKINCGGYLYITDNIPYNIKTLSIEFNRSVDEIKSAFKILRKLEMIEFTADKVFKIKNWDKHQNVDGMERSKQLNNERVARHRAKKREITEKVYEEKTNNNNDTQEIDEINSESNNEKINNIDVKDEENTSNFSGKEYKENFTNSSSIENNNDRSINDKCNVTCNSNDSNCNITVMEQIKKENKNKKENKKESKNDLENNDENKDLLEKSNRNNLDQADDIIDNKNININNQDVVKLLTYYESITGILGGLNIGFLKLAVEAHGYNNVKMAINKALEVNKANMTYINGILKNWRREGYPKDDVEVKKDGSRSTGKSNPADKNEFTGFKPKESRKLTEEQRKRAEENLI